MTHLFIKMVSNFNLVIERFFLPPSKYRRNNLILRVF